jgi:hypothetical protein
MAQQIIADREMGSTKEVQGCIQQTTDQYPTMPEEFQSQHADTHTISSPTPSGLVEVESASTPGLVHFLTPDLRHCSCKYHSFSGEVCSHQRIARIRRFKARVRERRMREREVRYGLEADHSRFGDEGLWHVVEVRNGERRRITSAATYDAAARDVRNLRAGNEAGRKLLARVEGKVA